MPENYTFQNPTLSLWQSAVAEVHRRQHSVRSRMAPATLRRVAPTPLLAEDDLMSPAHLLAAAVAANPGAPPPIAHSAPVAISAVAAGGVEGGPGAERSLLVPLDCAKLTAQFLWAEMKGDHKQSQLLASELKYAVCDVGGWAECVTTFLAFKLSGGNLPYRPNTDVVIDLGEKTRLAIVGDWGTGEPSAINLMQQVAALQPDVLIHLGDVYYSGTQAEAQSNFLDICRQVLGSSIPLFSLCGNHDMYSGGKGYYWLADRIGQQSSYFCLRNANWQFLAMDTGHNDHDPVTVNSNMTSLMTGPAGWSEADWHLGKIRSAGGRKNVLLSHHQLFSPFGSVGKADGKDLAFNPNLLANFETVLPEIEWWFWGHEHTLGVFDPYMGLKRGRCVGASAVPVFTDQQKYETAAGLATYKGAPMPTWNRACQLGDNGTDYNKAFALMTLNGPSAHVVYYQVPVLGTATRFPISDTCP